MFSDLLSMPPAALREIAPQIARWLFDRGVAQPEALLRAGLPDDRAQVALALCERLFLKAPPLALSRAAVSAFEQLIEQHFDAPAGRQIAYDLPYPKHEFLRYLTEHKRCLLHGSSHTGIERLQPRQQSDWAGRPVNAVFASGDGIWPLFFACIPQTGWPGSLRNACLVIDTPDGSPARFYFFSINEHVLPRAGWVNGMIYILRAEGFRRAAEGPVRFDEWISARETPIAARLPVSPADFPLLRSVTGHPEDGPVFETWLRYKTRLAAAG